MEKLLHGVELWLLSLTSHLSKIAVGREDTRIKVPISVTLGDPDGSEKFVTFIESSNLPQGTTLFGENGATLLPSSPGNMIVLSPADVEELAMQPPLHWTYADDNSFVDCHILWLVNLQVSTHFYP